MELDQDCVYWRALMLVFWCNEFNQTAISYQRLVALHQMLNYSNEKAKQKNMVYVT
jgi:hypothetical protein